MVYRMICRSMRQTIRQMDREGKSLRCREIVRVPEVGVSGKCRTLLPPPSFRDSVVKRHSTRSRDLIISDWAIAGIPSLTLPSGYCWGIKNWGEKDGSAPVRWGVATEVETNKQLARGLGCVFTHKAAKLCIIPCSSLARSVCSRRVGPGECCLYRYLYYRNKHRVVLVPLCLLCSLNCVTRSRGDVTLPITHLAVFLCSDGLQISR